MNYRITIEPLSEKALETIQEPISYTVDGFVLAGQYDPKEVKNYPLTTEQEQMEGKNILGQINVILGQRCVEALFQLIDNGLPERAQIALAMRMMKSQLGMVKTKEVASVLIDGSDSRGGGMNGSKI